MSFKPPNAVSDYNHLITTRPHDVCRVMISDLHLSADEPALAQAFLALLQDLIVLPNLKELYILGDWFDTWVGDDSYLSLSAIEKRIHWLTPIIDKLIELDASGCKAKIMHGNRDFLIGQQFCDLFNGELIFEPYELSIGKTKFRFEHGDALCTDDKAYQRFRFMIRNPLTQWLLLKRPLPKRIKLALKIRQKSSEGKSTKSMSIMDVNNKAVIRALNKGDALLHGHTHRPALHQEVIDKLDNKVKPRYVLGDWRVMNPVSSYEYVEAVIAISLVSNKPQLSATSRQSAMSINDHPINNHLINNHSNSDSQCQSTNPQEKLQLVKFNYPI